MVRPAATVPLPRSRASPARAEAIQPSLASSSSQPSSSLPLKRPPSLDPNRRRVGACLRCAAACGLVPRRRWSKSGGVGCRAGVSSGSRNVRGAQQPPTNEQNLCSLDQGAGELPVSSERYATSAGRDPAVWRRETPAPQVALHNLCAKLDCCLRATKLRCIFTIVLYAAHTLCSQNGFAPSEWRSEMSFAGLKRQGPKARRSGQTDWAHRAIVTPVPGTNSGHCNG